MKQIRLMILFVGMACLAFARAGHADTCEGDKLVIPDSKTLASVQALAEAGNVHAQAQVGEVYLLGYGVKLDTAKGLSWLEKSAAGGDSEGQYLLGAYYFQNGNTESDFRKAASLFKQSSDHGCIPSLLYLGLLTGKGAGVTKNTEDGFRMVSKAAEAGYPQAQMFLGVMFIAGEGTNKDTKAGFNWVKRGADAGDSAAEILLADLYLEGIGIEPNPEAARTILEKVYAKNDDQVHVAAFQLGWMYMEGKGVPVNTVKAFNWLYIAAKAHYSESEQRLITLTEQLPKRKLLTSCGVYMDPLFSTNGAKEYVHVNGGETVAVLTSQTAPSPEVYFPERRLLGYIPQKCLH
jgi:TPR repeat protein